MDRIAFWQALVVSLSLVAGNYAYQAFGEQHWMVAAERSFFQTGAIAIFLICAGLRTLIDRF